MKKCLVSKEELKNIVEVVCREFNENLNVNAEYDGEITPKFVDMLLTIEKAVPTTSTIIQNIGRGMENGDISFNMTLLYQMLQSEVDKFISENY